MARQSSNSDWSVSQHKELEQTFRRLEWVINVGGIQYLSYGIMALTCYFYFQFYSAQPEVLLERFGRLEASQKVILYVVIIVLSLLVSLALQFLFIIILSFPLLTYLFFNNGGVSFAAYQSLERLANSSKTFSGDRSSDVGSKLFEKLAGWSLALSVIKGSGPGLFEAFLKTNWKKDKERASLLTRAVDAGYKPALFTQALMGYSQDEGQVIGCGTIRQLIDQNFLPAIFYSVHQALLAEPEIDGREAVAQPQQAYGVGHLLRYAEYCDNDGFGFAKWASFKPLHEDLEWEWRRFGFDWDACFEGLINRLTEMCLKEPDGSRYRAMATRLFHIHRQSIRPFHRSSRLSLALHLTKGVGVRQDLAAGYAWLNENTDLLGANAAAYRDEAARSLTPELRMKYGGLVAEWSSLRFKKGPGGKLEEVEFLLGLRDYPEGKFSNGATVGQQMLVRTGHVFGWLGNLVGLLGICFGFVSIDWFGQLVLIGGGLSAFLLGRALRYIFAGSLF